MKSRKLELLAPAGSPEKLKMAIEYGADAVYLAGESFSLRAFADNFSIDELKEGIEYAHIRSRKVYLAVNIFPREYEIPELRLYLQKLQGIDIDALIVSDPGVLSIVKEKLGDIKIHLSTQANCTNAESAKFWYTQGVRRIVMAREVSLSEIRDIKDIIPEDLELEVFAHGAMCVSYSGRCLLSNYMADRDSNRGMCAQPCRWQFGIIDDRKPDEVYSFEEDDRGTYIMNSRDLCMIEHLDSIIDAGADSIKIEGRMKSAYYTAIVSRAYRAVLEAVYEGRVNDELLENAINELHTVSHRPYTTGFYLDSGTENTMEIKKGGYVRDYEFIGVVKGYDEERGMLIIEQRNRFFAEDDIEFITPDGNIIMHKLKAIFNEKHEEIESANHPKMTVLTLYDKEIPYLSVIRKKLRD